MPSITVSQETMNQLHDLAQHYGTTTSEAIAIAVRAHHSVWERDYKGVDDSMFAGDGTTLESLHAKGIKTYFDDQEVQAAMAKPDRPV